MIAKNQRFGLATTVIGDSFLGQAFDGILGLGFPNLSQISGNPLTLGLYTQGTLKRAIMGIWLGDGRGEIAFGGVNSRLYSGNIAWFKVTRPSYWQIPITKYQIGTFSNTLGSGNISTRSGNRAILDTGTSLMALPTRISNKINTMIGATMIQDGIWTVPCNNIYSLPKITLTFGGKVASDGTSINSDYVLLPQDYIIQLPGDKNNTIIHGKNDKRINDGTCVSCFTAVDIYNDEGLESWILGDPFLRKYYSVYDYTNQMIGLAQSN